MRILIKQGGAALLGAGAALGAVAGAPREAVAQNTAQKERTSVRSVPRITSRTTARATSRVPSSLRVVPGERIGLISLGESQAAIRRRLGVPATSFKLNNGLSSDLWRSRSSRRWDGQLHTFEVVYRRGVAVQIEATNPHFRTAGGLGLNSSDAAWARAFGPREESKQFRYTGAKKPQGYEDWVSRGFALEYVILPGDTGGNDTNVDEGAPVEMHTLIVHYRGVPVIPDPGGR